MDGIEFGQVEYREPESEARPDRNRQYAVVACGTPESDDLPIFVDLDVMRDMEGHARTNTHVELGGVLLGGKYLDEQGKPFVVIHEALRAEHYEATRGSFKFTHDTWAQISRDREQLPEDMHLVGWYHTHPDWGVFLSGMDMFICDNFFNDVLDVALVIDPCRGDRGWFFWEDAGDGKQKRRAAGFRLFANRFRRTELLQFAEALAVTNPAFFDPRYETPMGDSAMQPVVHLHDQKSPVLMIAVLGMLTIQTMVFALIAWRVLFPPANAESLAQNQRNEIYREVLGQMAESSPGGVGIIDRVEKLASNNLDMQKDLEGRGLLVDSLKLRGRELESEFSNTKKALAKRDEEAKQSKTRIENLSGKLNAEKDVNADIKKGKTIGGLSWWTAGIIAAATALFGLIGGTILGRFFANEEEDVPTRSGYAGESKIPVASDTQTGSADDLTFGDSRGVSGASPADQEQA